MLRLPGGSSLSPRASRIGVRRNHPIGALTALRSPVVLGHEQVSGSSGVAAISDCTKERRSLTPTMMGKEAIITCPLVAATPCAAAPIHVVMS